MGRRPAVFHDLQVEAGPHRARFRRAVTIGWRGVPQLDRRGERNGGRPPLLGLLQGLAEPCPRHLLVRMAPHHGDLGGQAQTVIATRPNLEQVLHSGKVAIQDYNMEDPEMDLLAEAPSSVSVGGNDRYEVYDYPGKYAALGDGQDEAKQRMEAEEAAALRVPRDAPLSAEPGMTFLMSYCQTVKNSSFGGQSLDGQVMPKFRRTIL